MVISIIVFPIPSLMINVYIVTLCFSFTFFKLTKNSVPGSFPKKLPHLEHSVFVTFL
jgi:hypothetical protein